MSGFKVNDFTTIKNFKRLSIYQKFMKHGKLQNYQRFVGTLRDDKVSGWISLTDSNIYKLTLDE